MSWLIETSLRLRLLVLLLAVALVVSWGSFCRHDPWMSFLSLRRRVEIQTEAPGISTEDVENA